MAKSVKLKDGQVTSRACPLCGAGSNLVVRTNKSNGSQFLGCANWPECEYTEDIPESILMEIMGQPRLL